MSTSGIYDADLPRRDLAVLESNLDLERGVILNETLDSLCSLVTLRLCKPAL